MYHFLSTASHLAPVVPVAPLQPRRPLCPVANEAKDTGDDEGAPKWWWQSWVGIEGSRKRKPTQLYEAGSSTAHSSSIRQGMRDGGEGAAGAAGAGAGAGGLLAGVSHLHMEVHRQGMHRWGLSWGALVLQQLLMAHLFSAGFLPFATEKCTYVHPDDPQKR